MPDLETRLPEMLRDLSAEMPVADRSAMPTLRRVRRRRLANAVGAGVLVVGLIAGSIGALRTLTPADRGMVAAPSEKTVAIWPETTKRAITEAQTSLSERALDARREPESVARAFARQVLGWRGAGIRSDIRCESSGLSCKVTLTLPSLLIKGFQNFPEVLTLSKLADADAGGIWSVVRVDNDALHLGQTPTSGTDSPVVSGTVEPLVVGQRPPHSVWVGALESGHRIGSSEMYHTVPVRRDGSFTTTIDRPSLESAGALAIAMFNGDLTMSWMTAFPLSAGAVPSPTAQPDAGLPVAVVQTREAIRGAVAATDFGAMRALIDPNGFSFNADDGSDPIPAWKHDPTLLDGVPEILSMPPTDAKEIEGYGTLYLWPYLVDSDFEHLSRSEVADLHALGFDDAAIDQMRTFGEHGMYLGPRLAIDSDGVWRNYTTGGE